MKKKSKDKLVNEIIEAMTWMVIGAFIMELFMIFVVYK